MVVVPLGEQISEGEPAVSRGLGCERNPSADPEVSEEGGEEERGSRGMDAPQDGRRSLGEPALEQAVTGGLRPAGRPHAREADGGLSPAGGTPRWSRGRVRSPPPEEEGAAETRGEEPTPTPIPRPPAPPPGGGGRENREWG